MASLKNVFGKCKSFPKKLQHVINAQRLKRKKNKVIKSRDYVEAIHLCRSMGDYEKDDFLLDFIDCQPGAVLFVLAFAKVMSLSYVQAYMRLAQEYDWDEAGLKADAEKTFDDNLCEYLEKYDSEDDCRYVLQLTDEKSWLKSYKMAEQGLL
jgi:hypothetical protein